MGVLLPSGEVTFLFTDIVGSTALLQRHGDGFAHLLDVHRRLLRAVVERRGGVEVATAGDGFFFAFSDPGASVLAAVDGQVALAGHPWPEDGVIQVRMGIHTGRAVPFGEDYVSLAVNQAARVSAAAHGGQILITGSTAERLTAGTHGFTVGPLGAFRLRGFEAPAVLCEIGYAGAPDAPPPAVPAVSSSNLPKPRTSFVGRDGEIETLTSIVQPGSVVNLVGPAGVGKTRLGTEVAARLSARFPDGVVFIDLSPLAAGGDVLSRVAHVIDPRGGAVGGDRIFAILDGSPLLVFDNCEHVIDEAAAAVDAIIDAVPAAAILATSQLPLGIDGERVFRLPPFTADDRDHSMAVRLFVERARAARLDFTADAEAMDDIVAIVRALDGLPLAIELAASRAGELSVAAIRVQLADRFDLLRKRRSTHERHRSLEAALTWSVDLLTPQECAALVGLGIFSDRFDEHAVAAVLAVPVADGRNMLATLVERSLVVADADADRPRYRLLESMRAFARARLDEDPVTYAALARRRFDWVLSRVRDLQDTAGEIPGLLEIRADLEESVRWAAREDPERGADAVQLAATQTLWEQGLPTEGARLLSFALAHAPSIDDNLRGAALKTLATLEYYAERYDDAQRTTEEAMAIARARGDLNLEARCFNNLGAIARERGALSEAMDHFTRAEAIARENAFAMVEMWALQHLGRTALLRGDLREARSYLQWSIDACRAMAPRSDIESSILGALADVAEREADLSGARAYAEEGLAIAMERGASDLSAGHVYRLGSLALRDGDHARAREYLELGSSMAAELGAESLAASCAELIAELDGLQGRPEDATTIDGG